ncbi:MAG TPA: PKD domain-containing protein [Candidatus Binataceae bacterium]|nr:PKD domain-containing protein [Candidatus Binataceae bacterium]HVA82328.1 PKD domain-containing protein [Candidatus Binataceae bacterium]
MMRRYRSAAAIAAFVIAAGAFPVLARAQDQSGQMGGGSSMTMPPMQSAPDPNGNPSAAPTAAIQFPNIPRITLQVLPGYGPAPLIVGFLVMSANPESAPLVSYRFSFGDGQISTEPPTVLYHSFANPGTYTVTVTATTADGQNATAIAGVTVTQAAD